MGEMMMMGAGEPSGPGPQQPPSLQDALMERSTLTLPNYTTNSLAQAGEVSFSDASSYVPVAENNAVELMLKLKAELRQASTLEFWGLFLQRLCAIAGAQCSFASKRILVNDEQIAVELPEPGEPAPYLVGIATYIDNGGGDTDREYFYFAEGTPCPCMKLSKVCVVPERFHELCSDIPNVMPGKKSEAFIAVPLFHEGICFANFGLIFDLEGARKRKLGWAFIELLMHSLEDLALQRILEGRGFAKDPILSEPSLVDPVLPEPASAKVIPTSNVTPSQSLKPYAQSLSHELRTPMQGVVGMLDIMYATVLDAIANQQSELVRAVFTDLKCHIEVVQESSKRAVEATDNVVHACDLNMQMPDTPLTPTEPGRQSPPITPAFLPRSRGNSETSSIAGTKRSSGHGVDSDFQPGPPAKRMFKMTETEIANTYYPVGSRTASISGSFIKTVEPPLPDTALSGLHIQSEPATPPHEEGIPAATLVGECLAHRHISIREFVRNIVNNALRASHLTTEVHTATDLGETIEVRSLGSRGEMQKRVMHLNIERDVPEIIKTDVQHLEFPIRKIVDNAIKFTEGGIIMVTVKLGKQYQAVEIWVADTGCGITEESKNSLFTPHFQEDASISRSRDGLGLSLFNAKAHVRMAFGGDVTLERSATDGPLIGSEFLIRLPISSVEAGSTNVPLMGLPTPAGQPCCRPEPPTNLGLPSISPEAISSFPVGRTQQSGPNLSLAKRVAFNRQLADEYPLNILIAEDNSINRHVALGSFNKLGYSKDRITVAFDGTEAVQRFEASLAMPAEQRFDAILMDIWMPNMDGYEASARILDLAKNEAIPPKIIAVTADITTGCVERAKASGMQGFLAKPYKVLDIEHLILQHFGKT